MVSFLRSCALVLELSATDHRFVVFFIILWSKLGENGRQGGLKRGWAQQILVPASFLLAASFKERVLARRIVLNSYVFLLLLLVERRTDARFLLAINLCVQALLTLKIPTVTIANSRLTMNDWVVVLLVRQWNVFNTNVVLLTWAVCALLKIW